MSDTLLIILVTLQILAFIILLILFTRKRDNGFKQAEENISELKTLFAKLESGQKDDFSKNREEVLSISRENRDELGKSFDSFSRQVSQRISDISDVQKERLEEFSKRINELTQKNEDGLDKMREVVEKKLEEIRLDSSGQLDKMRETVNEKLQDALEKKLEMSFKRVSENLENVQKGLGEMRELAADVGGLKKALTNVKTKGIIGEIQLDNLITEILTPSQYISNYKPVENSLGFVEYAIKLPGKDDENPVYLPIDSKFPLESYNQLIEAYDEGDKENISAKRRVLNSQITKFAQDISSKYISPPNTTDFAIMFLPTEGLFAEVLRDAGLFESIRRKQKIVITGPTTLTALLSSLQIGFRTLAIEKRSSEVWQVLGAVKAEFENFGNALETAKKNIAKAGEDIDKLVGTRTRAINRKLRQIESLDDEGVVGLIGDNEDTDEKEE